MTIKIYLTEDFQGQKHLDTNMIKRKLQIECERIVHQEVCGFIVKNGDDFDLIPVQNRSPKPEEQFYIPAKEFLHIKTNNEIVAVYHSHPTGPAKSSEFDETTSEVICYPFVIYSIDETMFCVYEPEYSDANSKDIEQLKKELL